MSAFAQTEVAIFAIIKQQIGAKNNEYLLYHRRSGRGHCGSRLSRSAPLMNQPLENVPLSMSKQYLAKALQYGDLAKTSVGSAKINAFQELEARFSVLAVLADNDELLREENAVCRTQPDDTHRMTPAAEDQVLRCLGAALIIQWNTLPAKLQRELFDDAGEMGELLDTSALRGQIARFLHTHKNDEATAAATNG
jgi:hypothetical protein